MRRLSAADGRWSPRGHPPSAFRHHGFSLEKREIGRICPTRAAAQGARLINEYVFSYTVVKLSELDI